MLLTMDFETRSHANLKKVGSWSYSEDPSTDVICLCWKVDDNPVEVWVQSDLARVISDDEIPPELADAIEEADEIEAHNVAFELSIWENVMVRRYGWPAIPLDKWRDSAAVAAYYSMPPSLDKLAEALGMEGKDREGVRLISKYSKLHLKTAKMEIPDDDLDLFVRYCMRDVELEYQIGQTLGELPDDELVIFQHDLAVNYRGLYLDLPGITSAQRVLKKRQGALAKEFTRITGLLPTQRDQIMGWCEENGSPLLNLQREYIEELLANERATELMKPEVLDALTVRISHARASTNKLDAMERQVGSDGRARFQTRYHGANTGRNTGAGFQPLNLSRGYENVEPEDLVEAIAYESPEYLDCLYGNAMEAVGNASRHWIQAAPGKVIRAGDYVSIEAVGLACEAGEQWKVEAFERGDPIYELMGAKIHKLPTSAVELARTDKKAFKAQYPAERQDGKTGELAFGYQGALGAWLKFDSSGRHSDERIVEICKAWRAEHPAIVAFWEGLQEAATLALTDPTGKAYGYGRVGFELVDGWLTMILPDNKRLWYWNPQMLKRMPAWHKPKELEECETGECGHKPIPQISYLSWKEGRWFRNFTYGGKLTENYIQAVCRQLLKHAELLVQSHGYDVILSVYDEIVCETSEDFGSMQEFSQLMAERPEWAKGWPIRVDPWKGKRYRK